MSQAPDRSYFLGCRVFPAFLITEHSFIPSAWKNVPSLSHKEQGSFQREKGRAVFHKGYKRRPEKEGLQKISPCLRSFPLQNQGVSNGAPGSTQGRCRDKPFSKGQFRKAQEVCVHLFEGAIGVYPSFHTLQ